MLLRKDYISFNSKLEKELNDSSLLLGNLKDDELSKNIIQFTNSEYSKIKSKLLLITEQFNSLYKDKYLPIMRFDCIIDNLLNVKCIEVNTGTPGMFVDIGTQKVINNKNIINEFEKNLITLFKDKNKSIKILKTKFKYDEFELVYLKKVLEDNCFKVKYINKKDIKGLRNSYLINLTHKKKLKKYKESFNMNGVVLINGFDGQKLENKKTLIKLSNKFPNSFAKTLNYKIGKKINNSYVIKKKKSNQGKDISVINNGTYNKIEKNILENPTKYIIQEKLESVILNGFRILLTFFVVNNKLSFLLFLEAKKIEEEIITSSSNLLCHIIND